MKNTRTEVRASTTRIEGHDMLPPLLAQGIYTWLRSADAAIKLCNPNARGLRVQVVDNGRAHIVQDFHEPILPGGNVSISLATFLPVDTVERFLQAIEATLELHTGDMI